MKTQIKNKGFDNRNNTETSTADSNTRSNYNPVLVTHLDYFRMRLEELSPEEYLSIMDLLVPPRELLIENGERYCLGDLKYENCFRSVNNTVRGGFTLHSNGTYSILFDATGQFFDGLLPHKELEFIRFFAQFKHSKCLRIDGCLDDSSGEIIRWQDYRDAIRKGNFAYAKKRKIIEDFVSSPTTYLGSRKSEKMLRVYVHENINRFEIEFKGTRAQRVFLILKDTICFYENQYFVSPL